MHAIWLAACLISANPEINASQLPAPAADAVANSTTPESLQKLAEQTPAQWRTTVQEALRKTNSVQPADLESAAETLLPLYQGLTAQTQLAQPEQEQLRQKVRQRLLSIQQGLVAKIRKDQNAILAQQLPAGGGKATAPKEDSGEQLVGAVKNIQPNQWVDRGGPGQAVLFPGGANGGVLQQQLPPGAKAAKPNAAKPADHGQVLVELIQSVIAPQSWEAQGGPGTIRYWAPGGALIINQTSEQQEQLGDLLRQLRRN